MVLQEFEIFFNLVSFLNGSIIGCGKNTDTDLWTSGPQYKYDNNNCLCIKKKLPCIKYCS